MGIDNDLFHDIIIMKLTRVNLKLTRVKEVLW